MDEITAVAASKTGDRKAFGCLVDQYYQGVYRFAYHSTGRHQDADDICQETFVRALDKIRGLRDTQNFRGWIFAIAANLVRRQVRRSWRTPKTETSVREEWEADGGSVEQTPAQQMTIAEQALRVQRELETMPEAVRMAAVLAFMEGHSQREVAAILGCSEATICRHLEAARTQLRARLRHWMD